MDGVFFTVLGIVMLGIILVLLYLLDKVNTPARCPWSRCHNGWPADGIAATPDAPKGPQA